MRKAILRSNLFYPVCILTRIVTACCLPHDLIRGEMTAGPIEEMVKGDEYKDIIESSNEWRVKRDRLANEMLDKWPASRRHSLPTFFFSFHFSWCCF